MVFALCGCECQPDQCFEPLTGLTLLAMDYPFELRARINPVSLCHYCQGVLSQHQQKKVWHPPRCILFYLAPEMERQMGQWCIRNQTQFYVGLQTSWDSTEWLKAAELAEHCLSEDQHGKTFKKTVNANGCQGEGGACSVCRSSSSRKAGHLHIGEQGKRKVTHKFDNSFSAKELNYRMWWPDFLWGSICLSW